MSLPNLTMSVFNNTFFDLSYLKTEEQRCTVDGLLLDLHKTI